MIVADEGSRTGGIRPRARGRSTTTAAVSAWRLPLARRVIEGHGGRMLVPRRDTATTANADPLSRGVGRDLVPLGS